MTNNLCLERKLEILYLWKFNNRILITTQKEIILCSYLIHPSINNCLLITNKIIQTERQNDETSSSSNRNVTSVTNDATENQSEDTIRSLSLSKPPQQDVYRKGLLRENMRIIKSQSGKKEENDYCLSPMV